MDIKKRLASDLVTQFHSAEAAIEAQAFFELTVQGRGIPEDIPTFNLSTADGLEGKRLSDILLEANLASSSGEARRLINQGAVRLDDQPIPENVGADTLTAGVLRVGRRRYLRLVSGD
jgi:tyrosyl-tRNA synthetase